MNYKGLKDEYLKLLIEEMDIDIEELNAQKKEIELELEERNYV